MPYSMLAYQDMEWRPRVLCRSPRVSLTTLSSSQRDFSAWPPSSRYQEWPCYCCICQEAMALISWSLSPCFLGLSIPRYLSKNWGCCLCYSEARSQFKKIQI